MSPAEARPAPIARRSGAAAAVGQESDAIDFVISTPEIDDGGFQFVQEGLTFADPLPAQLDHTHTIAQRVGSWVNVRRSEEGNTLATLQLLPKGVSRMADLVRAFYEQGHRLAASIFAWPESRAALEPIDTPRGKKTGVRVKRANVTEISVVATPGNANALSIARSLGFDDCAGLLAAWAQSSPAGSGSRPAPIARGTPMDFAAQLAAAEAAADQADAELQAATAALDANEATVQALQRATATSTAAVGRLRSLREAEAAAAARAALRTAAGTPPPVVPGGTGAAGVAAPGVVRRSSTRELEPGTRLAQLAIAGCIARSQKRNIFEVANEVYAAEPDVIAIARAAVGAADTTTAGWAAELVRAEARALLNSGLVPKAIWPALSARGTSLNFNGSQSILVPMINVGTAVGGAWVGEGGVIPLVKGNITGKRLGRYKLGGIIPYTKELERASDPQAVTVMRQILAQVISNLLDNSLIDAGAAVADVRPAGLLNGVAAIPGAAGGGMAAALADFKAISTAFAAANVGSNPVLLMNPITKMALGLITNALGQMPFQAEVNAGNFQGWPIIDSQLIPVDVMIAVDAQNFASAIDTPEFDTSEQVTLTMADAGAAAPTQAGAAAFGGALGTPNQVVPDGGIPVAGGSGASIAGVVAMSVWQTWSVAIRLVLPSSFGVLRAGSVQLVNALTWD